MKNMGKKPIFVILALILVMSISFVVVAAPALEDLKKIFVTRDEVASFESSVSGLFSSLENYKQLSIQNEVGYQMYRRGIKLPTEEGSTINPSLMSSWSERRSRELETMPSGLTSFGVAAPEVSETTTQASAGSNGSQVASPSSTN